METPIHRVRIDVGPLGYQVVRELAASHLALGGLVVVDLVHLLPIDDSSGSTRRTGAAAVRQTHVVRGNRLRDGGRGRTTPLLVGWPERPRLEQSPMCARILYMITLPLAEVRAQLSKLVDEAQRTHQRIEVTKNGRRAAVLLSADDYDSLIETLEILGDAETMAEIRESERAVARGEVYSLDQVRAEMQASGRLSR